MRAHVAAFVLGFCVVAAASFANPRVGLTQSAGQVYLNGATPSSGQATDINFLGDTVSCTLSGVGAIAQCSFLANTTMTAINAYQGVMFAAGDGGSWAWPRVSVQDGGNGGRMELRPNTLAHQSVDGGTSSDMIVGARVETAALTLPFWQIARPSELFTSPQQAMWDTNAWGVAPQPGGYSTWGSTWAVAGSIVSLGLDAGNPDGGSVPTYRYTHRSFGYQNASATGSSAEFYASGQMSLARGDGTNYGGFTCVMDFSLDYASGNGAVGLFATNAALGAVDYTAQSNFLGVAYNTLQSGTQGLKLYTNSPTLASNASCTAANYAIGNLYNVYRLTIVVGTSALTGYAYLELSRLDDPTVPICNRYIDSTSGSLPGGATLWSPHFGVNNLTTTGTSQVNIFGSYCQSNSL